ncbi:MAG: hypothetical protein COA78_16495 [Blastopirellula sp.]|nr:MAG: hypothetical protein COA78_16495 [Blastopirellula sp.]
MLIGSGAAITLPFLESLAAPKSLLANEKSAENPMRMVCIGLEYGLYPTDFFPEETGRDYKLPKLLEPLASLRNEYTVFSGLDHPGISGGHYVTHTFLSGIKSDQAKAQPEGNISVDQKAAEFVGAKTRFPSIQLGLGGGGVSWTRNGVEIPPITHLQTMFDALFLETPESKRKRLSGKYDVNRSILDVVQDDAMALKKRISHSDLDKLDEYFTSIREVEKRLLQSEVWLKKAKPKTGFRLPRSIPDDFYGETPLFYDLMKIALQTNSTRIISLAINGWGGSSGLPGVTKGYHDITHHGRNKEKLKQLSIIDTFHTSQFARFLESLKRTQASADASLLDNTMVLFGSGLGNASSHSNRNLPLVLAGGKFQHGEHKAYSITKGQQTPACNLYVSMLQRFGLQTDQFGTSTGTLQGLS